jgi:hypothetical protein
LTFKDLKKTVSSETPTQQQQYSSKNNLKHELLRNKPFWIWNIEEHRQEDIGTNCDCCYNHIIGLPTKGRIEKPLFDYEKMLYDSLLASLSSSKISLRPLKNWTCYRTIHGPTFSMTL